MNRFDRAVTSAHWFRWLVFAIVLMLVLSVGVWMSSDADAHTEVPGNWCGTSTLYYYGGATPHKATYAGIWNGYNRYRVYHMGSQGYWLLQGTDLERCFL